MRTRARVRVRSVPTVSEEPTKLKVRKSSAQCVRKHRERKKNEPGY